MRRRKTERRLILSSGAIRLAIGSLALCVASSAGAQGSVKQGKTLYAAECARCHKSPQSVTTFHGGVDLETFLGEQHYATTHESAAAIAAFLKGLERRPLSRRRPARIEASPSSPTPSDQSLANSPTPTDNPLRWLFEVIKDKSNQAK
jgi:hypothetical protein